MSLSLLLQVIAFFRSEDGQDLAEYGLLLALVAVVVVVVITLTGTQIDALWQRIMTAFPGS